MVEDVAGDDTVREQSVPSVTVDLSSGFAGATPGQVPPSAGTQAMVTIAVVSPWKTPPTTGEKGRRVPWLQLQHLGYLEGKYYQ
jgi:hypothetical protein